MLLLSLESSRCNIELGPRPAVTADIVELEVVAGLGRNGDDTSAVCPDDELPSAGLSFDRFRGPMAPFLRETRKERCSQSLSYHAATNQDESCCLVVLKIICVFG